MHGLKAPKHPLAEVDTRLLCTGEESENFLQNTWKTAFKAASKGNDNFSELFLKGNYKTPFVPKISKNWKVLTVVTSTYHPSIFFIDAPKWPAIWGVGGAC